MHNFIYMMRFFQVKNNFIQENYVKLLIPNDELMLIDLEEFSSYMLEFKSRNQAAVLSGPNPTSSMFKIS